MGIEIRSEGRRHYLVGLPFGSYRAQGANWDPERKLWWTGKRELAEQLAAVAPVTAPKAVEPQIVAGSATYKGRPYYVAGRVERGRTHYDDRVTAVTTRDGAKVLLLFRDGSSQFWADRSLVSVVKRYDRPQTIAGLARFAEERRAGLSKADFDEEVASLDDQDPAAASRLEAAGYAAWRTAQERR